MVGTCDFEYDYTFNQTKGHTDKAGDSSVECIWKKTVSKTFSKWILSTTADEAQADRLPKRAQFEYSVSASVKKIR